MEQVFPICTNKKTYSTTHSSTEDQCCATMAKAADDKNGGGNWVDTLHTVPKSHATHGPTSLPGPFRPSSPSHVEARWSIHDFQFSLLLLGSVQIAKCVSFIKDDSIWKLTFAQQPKFRDDFRSVPSCNSTAGQRFEIWSAILSSLCFSTSPKCPLVKSIWDAPL